MHKETSTNPFLMDPFATADQRNIIQRHRYTLDFIGSRHLGRTLDVGDRNPLTVRLEEKFGVSIESTTGDLDSIDLDGMFNTIFCFEVIEHLMNPLRLLQGLRRILRPNGSLFLSTPKHKPHFLWDVHHFTELDRQRLQSLVDRAAFSISRNAEFRTMPFWWYFTGVRPLVRMFFNKIFILELRPIDTPSYSSRIIT